MDSVMDQAQGELRQAAMAARGASRALAVLPAAQRDAGLRAAAAALRAHAAAIQAANDLDTAAFSGSAAFLDRLRLTPARIEAMARGLDDIAALPDPLAGRTEQWVRPNGDGRPARPVSTLPAC